MLLVERWLYMTLAMSALMVFLTLCVMKWLRMILSPLSSLFGIWGTTAHWIFGGSHTRLASCKKVLRNRQQTTSFPMSRVL